MIKRGEIYFVSLDPVKGRGQSGYRPVLVVSSDGINSGFSSSLIRSGAFPGTQRTARKRVESGKDGGY